MLGDMAVRHPAARIRDVEQDVDRRSASAAPAEPAPTTMPSEASVNSILASPNRVRLSTHALAPSRTPPASSYG